MSNDDDRAGCISAGLWTVKEAATFLRLSRSKIYELMDAGRLTYAKFGRSRRIPRLAVERLAVESLIATGK